MTEQNQEHLFKIDYSVMAPKYSDQLIGVKLHPDDVLNGRWKTNIWQSLDQSFDLYFKGWLTQTELNIIRKRIDKQIKYLQNLK